MKDKICLITGATDGIGKETARCLGKQNAQLILVGRNPEKGEKVQKKLIAITGNDQIDIMTADLSNMNAIQKLSAEIHKKYNKLNVLINNAGAFFSKREITDDGFEKTFALNHLGYFLLTKLLLDLIKKGKTPRIINVASGAHIGATLDFDNLQGKNDYSGWAAYKRSKLMNIMFTYKLAELLKDTPITVNTLHPGFVRTRFGDNNTGIVGIGLNLVKKIGAISIKKGAETSVFLATSPTVKGVSGKYFVKCKPEKSSSSSYNKSDIDRLWRTTDECLSSLS
ncbi:MAG TPA: short-chain dehydrogenase [Candidatus Marinimicrobia bacterium]|nr:short-chain dehydrogenase [Candidatus Neomarinimicrobiota bacterium]